MTDPPPGATVTEEPQALTEPVQLERSQRDRRPPRYLADYAVGHLELPPHDSSPPNQTDYPALVSNSFRYLGGGGGGTRWPE